MVDKRAAPNTLASAVRNRSVAQGDVPEGLRRRYFVDGRGGAGLGFYVDANIDRPAFRDEGKRLAAARADPNAIRDMVLVAQHRGWSIVTAHGSKEFKREAWLAGRALGLEVRGYRPTERDIQELDRRIDRRQAAEARSAGRHREDDGPAPTEASAPRRRERADARDQLRVVEAVVRSRVASPEAQERILGAARTRVADWLERGANFDPLRQATQREPVRADRSRERQR